MEGTGIFKRCSPLLKKNAETDKPFTLNVHARGKVGFVGTNIKIEICRQTHLLDKQAWLPIFDFNKVCI
ncbi:hypothetical protein [Methanolobus halotolerans]|uniref:hypothetical protein n=1 Tax=Methanolobus halotolerans TaxID=2052935 RepID=UPI00107F7F31|nr:hypothetical protein [Methanolobus halotolerans]